MISSALTIGINRQSTFRMRLLSSVGLHDSAAPLPKLSARICAAMSTSSAWPAFTALRASTASNSGAELISVMFCDVFSWSLEVAILSLRLAKSKLSDSIKGI